MPDEPNPPVTPNPITPETPPAGEPPKLFAGKYKSVEELEKGYLESQKLLSTKKPADDGALKIEKPAPGPPVIEDVSAVLTKAGLDPAQLTAAWQTNGTLPDTAYEALKKQGFGKAAVDGFIEGRAAKAALAQAQQVQIRMQASALVGSEEQLAELLTSAKDFIPAEEQDDFNRRLGDPLLFKGALQDIKARHAASVGAGGSRPLVNGGQAGAPSLPKNVAEFNELSRRASRGDASAEAIIKQVPLSKFEEWMHTPR